MSTDAGIDRTSDKRYDCFISFPGSQNLSDLGFQGPGFDSTVRALVIKVDERLRKFRRHPSVFYDHREIEGHWKDYLSKAILQLRGGGVALVFLTADYLRRKYCLAELRAFLELERMTAPSGRASEAVHIIVVNLEQDKHVIPDALRNDAIKHFFGTKLNHMQCTPLSVETRSTPARAVNEICTSVEKYWCDRRRICLGKERKDCMDYLAAFFSSIPSDDISRHLGLSSADFREGRTVGSIFHEALAKGSFSDPHCLSNLSKAAPDDNARAALGAFQRKWSSDEWEWSIVRGENGICLERFISEAQVVIDALSSTSSASGSSFSNPEEKGIELQAQALRSTVTPADAVDNNRSVNFAISNNTDKELILLGSHMDCGEISTAPLNIQPRESASGQVKCKIGANGVKGALIYQWCGPYNDMVRLCMYFENSNFGENKSGIEYYWNSRESWDWYCSNSPATVGQEVMKCTIDEWLTIKSFVSSGNHAGGAFVVEALVI